MSKLFAALGFCAMMALAALPAFAAELYEDPATGQIFTKPGEGRAPLSIPAEKVGGLYEDQSGMVYSKPGEGRTPVAVAEGRPATEAQSEAAESAPAGDYSTSAFTEAVRHVISDDESTTYPKVKVGELFYAKYSYDFEHKKANLDGRAEGANKFDLTRGYINVRSELTPEIKARVTPDITRDSTGDFKFRLKFGYVDFHDFLKVYPSLEVKAGQFEGPWLDYEEGLWTYRMQGTMLVEREGFLNSADLGVNLYGKLPGGYGEWQADVDNGEGYHSDEPNKYKSFGARITLIPMPDNDYLKGLQLTGFYTGGEAQKNLHRDRAIAFLGYKYKDDLFVGGEYLWTRGEDGAILGSTTLLPTTRNFKGSGYSALAWYRIPLLKPLRLMGRFDHFNHDMTLAKATDTRYVFGASYDIGKYVTFLLDDERQLADKRLRTTAGTKVKDQNLIEATVQWKFN